MADKANENSRSSVADRKGTADTIASMVSVGCDEKLPAALTVFRSILSKYVRFLQSPHRQDSILKTAQYSLWLLSKFYRNNPGTKKQQHGVAESLLKLQGEISWARYLLRFFGFPAAINDENLTIPWAKGNISTNLGKVMSWTMVAYYPLEHLSYLLWKAPGIHWLPGAHSSSAPKRDGPGACLNRERYSPAELAAKASAWSCRFWLAWIVLDIVRSTIALREMQQTEAVEKAEKESSLQQQDKYKEIAIIRTKKMQILRGALYLLPAINWSLPDWDTKPWLSGDFVNGLCWLESMLGLYQGVQNFQ